MLPAMTVVCLGCEEKGPWKSTCSVCTELGLTSTFCGQDCYRKNYPTQRRLKHAKLLKDHPSSGSALLALDELTYTLFRTEGCKVTLRTPRLVMRPVDVSDRPRVFAIKSEPAVNRNQFYGDPSRSYCDGVTMSYFLDSLPLVCSNPSPAFARVRYLFALTAARDEAGQPKVQARPSEARKAMDAEGYMGNLAIELSRPDDDAFKPNKAMDAFFLGPLRNTEFRYPSAQELKDWGVYSCLWYELHPSFHGQGLMSEAMEAALRYSFDVLRLPAVKIDPRSTNKASIALAKKFGGVFEKTTVAAHHMGVSQDVYWVNREEWYDAEKTRERGTKERPSEEASFGCRWCQRADSTAEVSCPRCDSAKYCSDECRRADLSFSGKGYIAANYDLLSQFRAGHAIWCSRTA